LQVSIQFQIVKEDEKIHASYYRLSNPRKQIEAYVYDVVRATVPKIELDDVFLTKEEIARSISENLREVSAARAPIPHPRCSALAAPRPSLPMPTPRFPPPSSLPPPRTARAPPHRDGQTTPPPAADAHDMTRRSAPPPPPAAFRWLRLRDPRDADHRH
jgi:hypothetical protein